MRFPNLRRFRDTELESSVADADTNTQTEVAAPDVDIQATAYEAAVDSGASAHARQDMVERLRRMSAAEEQPPAKKSKLRGLFKKSSDGPFERKAEQRRRYLDAKRRDQQSQPEARQAQAAQPRQQAAQPDQSLLEQQQREAELRRQWEMEQAQEAEHQRQLAQQQQIEQQRQHQAEQMRRRALQQAHEAQQKAQAAEKKRQWALQQTHEAERAEKAREAKRIEQELHVALARQREAHMREQMRTASFERNRQQPIVPGESRVFDPREQQRSKPPRAGGPPRNGNNGHGNGGGGRGGSGRGGGGNGRGGKDGRGKGNRNNRSASAKGDKQESAAAKPETKKKSAPIQPSKEILQQTTTARVLKGIFYANLLIIAILLAMVAGLNVVTYGDLLATIARICGLYGTYLLLVQFLLVGRLPWLDRVFGTDLLVRWHKKNGMVSFTLIIVHAIGAVLGTAEKLQVSIAQMLAIAVVSPWIYEAILGTIIIAAVVGTSIKRARAKIRHEGWHALHMWTYVGVILSFGHQLEGPDFADVPLAQAYLWLLYLVTFGTILWFRIIQPVFRTVRHQVRVERVVEEAPGYVSIYMKGFALTKLHAHGGQYFRWRFLTRDDWREVHPYSLSAAPTNDSLRITIKAAGDSSGRAKTVPEGTWVAIEGPYGGMTAESRLRRDTVLIGGGIGITPARSLLEEMLQDPGTIDVLYRITDPSEAVLLEEVNTLAESKGAKVHIVAGSRKDYPADAQPLSPQHLTSLVPDIADRDVFICASPGLTDAVLESLIELGLPDQQLHFEAFG